VNAHHTVAAFGAIRLVDGLCAAAILTHQIFPQQD